MYHKSLNCPGGAVSTVFVSISMSFCCLSNSQPLITIQHTLLPYTRCRTSACLPVRIYIYTYIASMGSFFIVISFKHMDSTCKTEIMLKCKRQLQKRRRCYLGHAARVCSRIFQREIGLDGLFGK